MRLLFICRRNQTRLKRYCVCTHTCSIFTLGQRTGYRTRSLEPYSFRCSVITPGVFLIHFFVGHEEDTQYLGVRVMRTIRKGVLRQVSRGVRRQLTLTSISRLAVRLKRYIPKAGKPSTLPFPQLHPFYLLVGWRHYPIMPFRSKGTEILLRPYDAPLPPPPIRFI